MPLTAISSLSAMVERAPRAPFTSVGRGDVVATDSTLPLR